MKLVFVLCLASFACDARATSTCPPSGHLCDATADAAFYVECDPYLPVAGDATKVTCPTGTKCMQGCAAKCVSADGLPCACDGQVTHYCGPGAKFALCSGKEELGSGTCSAGYGCTKQTVCGKMPPFVCPAADGRFAVLNSCTKYFECQAAVAVESTCPQGSNFNPATKKCSTFHACVPA